MQRIDKKQLAVLEQCLDKLFELEVSIWTVDERPGKTKEFRKADGYTVYQRGVVARGDRIKLFVCFTGKRPDDLWQLVWREYVAWWVFVLRVHLEAMVPELDKKRGDRLLGRLMLGHREIFDQHTFLLRRLTEFLDEEAVSLEVPENIREVLFDGAKRR